MANTWKRAKGAWYGRQRQECAANTRDDAIRADLAAFLLREDVHAALAPWFDRLAQAQREGRA